MVLCTMDALGAVPRPPPLSGLQNPVTKQASFRLQKHQDDCESVYSAYKQKIDSMFEANSETSSTSDTRHQHSPHNSVQARIEKMFADVAVDNGIANKEIGLHHFSVDYLGSVPLHEKVTSLCGLQGPLRDLYFAYQRSGKAKRVSGLSGRLEISAAGLKVQYLGDKGDLEQLNSFPTIAVWSAVKFVFQDEDNSYAFLPLITDPDNLDKRQLFRDLSQHERGYISSETGHWPLFAVVMRKIGVHKQLECHAFVCQTSEDAIVIAATLYKSLMAHMKARERRGPKNKNGLSCMSVASSSFNDPAGVPVRPPRKKRSTASSSVVSDVEVPDTVPLIENKKRSSKAKKAPKVPDDDDADAIVTVSDDCSKIIVPNKWNSFISTHQKQITEEIKQVMSASSNMGLKRVKSLRKGDEDKADQSGDILTKVTIPRSGSFLNAGGLTRYKSKVQRFNGQATGGSPLGFNELFNEFRLQEGLHSLDEILGVIIDPEGMSFNDLKPIYKEFLLKLSVTLTKDELYQRSKSIMRRHRKKMMRRPNHGGGGPAKKRVVLGSKFRKLKHVFQRRLSSNSKHSSNADKAKVIETKIPESSISTSSYDTRHFVPKEADRHRHRRDRHSTSEESDFFSLRLRRNQQVLANGGGKNNNHNRHSSSGYVSCSECSFDSDTCTCTSADKCYCSLGNKSKRCVACDAQSMTWCGCDTDSCTDSNKCYCTLSPRGVTIFEQLRQRGFVPATTTITTPKGKKKRYANTRSSKSLEYVPAGAYCPQQLGSNKGHNHVCKKSAEIAAVFTAEVHSKPRMISNSLYGSRRHMYSTKNGLYTIQSQSDDSSGHPNRLLMEQTRYNRALQAYSDHTNNGSLENSLGYLP